MTSAAAERVNLGKLNIPTTIPVYTLPSDTQAVMVKYKPRITISFIMPPKTFKTKFLSRGRYSGSRSFREVSIETPTLIFSQNLSFIPSNSQGDPSSGYSICAYDTSRPQEIYAKPYKLANVHDNGSICFGGIYPKNPKQAYNYFWASGFNSDLSGEAVNAHSAFCAKVQHHYRGHTGCGCDGSKTEHKCSCARKPFHAHAGCGCTTVAASNKCKGKCQESLTKDQIKYCKCCEAYQAHWLQVDLGQRKKRDQVTSCGCTYRHKRGCECSYGRAYCDCPCSCDCCTEQCSHNRACKCSCCQGLCGCDCRCTAITKFVLWMEHYSTKILPKKTWQHKTAEYCGTEFWAAPRGADGIVLTSEKSIIKQIPKQFHRADADGQPFIVALANQSEDGKTWCCESGNYEFQLDASKVTIPL